VLLAVIGLTGNFALALGLLAAWCLVFAIESPLRQAFINGLIPSEQRATVLSFDSLMGSAGGVVAQPALGRAADVYGYAASYVVAAGVQALAIPFAVLARWTHATSDPIEPDRPRPEGPLGAGLPVDPITETARVAAAVEIADADAGAPRPD
jgi:MFS family permease